MSNTASKTAMQEFKDWYAPDGIFQSDSVENKFNELLIKERLQNIQAQIDCLKGMKPETIDDRSDAYLDHVLDSKIRELEEAKQQLTK